MPVPEIDRIVARLLAHEPETVCVLVTGSYAKATADATSDLDLTAISPSPRTPYRMWFEGDLHVSAAAKTAEQWREATERPAAWALGFPARTDARYVRGAQLFGDDPSLTTPAGEPELEDFVEHALKARRFALRGDATGRAGRRMRRRHSHRAS